MRAAILAAVLLWTTAAFAEDYPNRPIRIIVPTPAGGPVDVMARVLANALPSVLGQLLRTSLRRILFSHLTLPL